MGPSTIHEVAAGDPLAATQLAQYLTPRLRNLGRYLLPNDKGVDSLAQRLLIDVLLRAPTYQDQTPIEKWVDLVVARCAFHLLKNAKGSPPEARDDVHPASDDDEYMSRRATASMLDTVPQQERLLLVLHGALHVSLAELAVMGGMTPEDVRGRIQAYKMGTLPLDSRRGPALVADDSVERGIVDRAVEAWENGPSVARRAITPQVVFALVLLCVIPPTVIASLRGLHRASNTMGLGTESPTLSSLTRDDAPEESIDLSGSPNLAAASHASAEVRSDEVQKSGGGAGSASSISQEVEEKRAELPLLSAKPSLENAEALARQGHWEAAAEMYEKIRRDGSSSVKHIAAIAEGSIRLRRLGAAEKALKAFKMGILVSPKGPRASDAHLGVGDSYSALGRMEEARAAWEQAHQLFPRSSSGRLAQRRLRSLELDQ